MGVVPVFLYSNIAMNWSFLIPKLLASTETSTAGALSNQLKLLGDHFTIYCKSGSTQCNAAFRHMSIWVIADREASKLSQCLPFMEKRFAPIFSLGLSCYTMLESEPQIPLYYEQGSKNASYYRKPWFWKVSVQYSSVQWWLKIQHLRCYHSCIIALPSKQQGIAISLLRRHPDSCG